MSLQVWNKPTDNAELLLMIVNFIKKEYCNKESGIVYAYS